jgi:hypothetical protein
VPPDGLKGLLTPIEGLKAAADAEKIIDTPAMTSKFIVIA